VYAVAIVTFPLLSTAKSDVTAPAPVTEVTANVGLVPPVTFIESRAKVGAPDANAAAETE
jgi:hypothetical protein